MKNYDDIIGLPHHVSATHPHMSVADRAAQFSPFAALTGYEEVIDETGRRTDARPEQDEARLAELDAALRAVMLRGGRAHIVWFAEDVRKEGGHFCSADGTIAKIDAAGRRIVLEDGTAILTRDIVELF